MFNYGALTVCQACAQCWLIHSELISTRGLCPSGVVIEGDLIN